LQAKSVEGAEALAVQEDLDCTEKSDLQPRWRFPFGIKDRFPQL
jgi:hypothetical protein